MELIKISQTKLKVMLSAEDVKRFELKVDNVCDISKRSAFRNILKEVKDICGFDASGERVFVQYFPEKSGGCEMFITKLSESLKDKLPMGSAGDVTTGRFYHSEIRERYDSGYIIYSFSNLGLLLSTCKRLKSTGFMGESRAYRIIDRCRYYLVLSDETYFAAENNGVRCASSFYYVILEHGELISGDAVECLAAFG